MHDNFIDIAFTEDNLDRYYIRTSIKEAISKHLPLFSGELLDIGCGKMPYKNFILNNSQVTKYTGLDIENALQYDCNIKPDITWDALIMPFQDNNFDCAFGTEVLEHCPNPDIILRETYRVLKEGGVFFFTVPFLWPLHETPHDEYRFTPWSLGRHLNNAGFRKVELFALGGWHASMAQMLGLWINRAPISQRKRKLILPLVKKVIARLIKMDKTIDVDFKESQMITGLSGIAHK